MPVCSICGVGYTSCACHLKPKLPKVGQTLRVVRKLEGGLIETLEGPVVGVAASPTGTLKSVTLGASGGYTRGVIVAKVFPLIEDATWEVVLLPEPPNKSVWVCPESSDQGKLAIWRRLDHAAAGSDSRWFYPGSRSGATWAQVCNAGAGYLLDPGAGPQND